MSIIQIIDAFTFYGVDVLMLAGLTAVCVQIFKATFLKKIRKKLLTFLPFCLGTFFYAAYSDIKNLDFFYVFENYVSVLEHGFAVGAAATLIYVLYEQFVREKSNVSATEGVISTLIEGYVPDENAERVAKLIAEAIERDVTGNGAKRAEELLLENANGEVTERDVQLLSKLIIETLAHINA